MKFLMNIVKILTYPFKILRDFLLLFIIYMPGSFGYKIRYIYYKPRFKKMGKNVLIDIGVSISGANLITVGNNVHIDKNCIISTGDLLQGKLYRKSNKEFSAIEGEIIIGDDIHICPNCMIIGYGGLYIGDNSTLSAGSKLYSLTNIAYNPDDRSEIISIMPYEQAPFLIGPIILKSNVWLGLNCIIMPNVEIKKNSFALSNSLVVSNFAENSYVGGQPAVLIKNRFKI